MVLSTTEPAAGPAGRTASGVNAWVARHAAILVVLLVAAGTARIAATYPVYSTTSDEPAHIACGMEWLARGTYRLERQHPPLSRVAVALGPYLAGRRALSTGGMLRQGTEILGPHGQRTGILTLARMGNLPFFWLAAVMVYFLGKELFGRTAGVYATFLFTLIPPVLAHAGLATTDISLTGFMAASFLALLVWLRAPSIRNSLLFGTAVALGVLSKLSMLPFFPSAVFALLVVWLVLVRPGWRDLLHYARTLAIPFAVSVAMGALVIWAGYRFDIGRTADGRFPLPAEGLFQGIGAVQAHQAGGHAAYLLGKRSGKGFPNYYPVDLAIKTPLALLLLCGIAVVFWLAAGKRRREDLVWVPIALSVGILAYATTSRINIGVRHVLPLYPLLAVWGAAGLVRLLDQSRAPLWSRAAAGLLVGWLTVSSALAHPDYLPYFNEIAAEHPEEWVADSDLDWGQNRKRLLEKMDEAGARVLYSQRAELATLPSGRVLEIRPADPRRPTPGWNAVSMQWLKVNRLGLRGEEARQKLWPETIPPTAKIAKGIWLWYIPEPGKN